MRARAVRAARARSSGATPASPPRWTPPTSTRCSSMRPASSATWSAHERAGGPAEGRGSPRTARPGLGRRPPHMHQGNYKSFGDTKFIPGLSQGATTLDAILAATQPLRSAADEATLAALWAGVRGPAFSLSPRERQLGLGASQGISTYFSYNCTDADAQIAQRFLIANGTLRPKGAEPAASDEAVSCATVHGPRAPNVIGTHRGPRRRRPEPVQHAPVQRRVRAQARVRGPARVRGHQRRQRPDRTTAAHVRVRRRFVHRHSRRPRTLYGAGRRGPGGRDPTRCERLSTVHAAAVRAAPPPGVRGTGRG